MEPNNSTWPYDSENAKNIVQSILSVINGTPQNGDFENKSDWPYDSDDAKNIVEAILKFTGAPKSYSCYLSNLGVADPFVQELNNTFGAPLVWKRQAVGVYTGKIITHLFPQPKTFVIVSTGIVIAGGGNLIPSFSIAQVIAGEIIIYTFDALGVPSDLVLSNSYFQLIEFN